MRSLLLASFVAVACSSAPGEVVLDEDGSATDAAGAVDAVQPVSDRGRALDDVAPSGLDVVTTPGLDAMLRDAAIEETPPPPFDAGAMVPGSPPAARPPAPPPDRAAVVRAVAAEHPDWLAGSCVAMGGSWRFLFEVLRRLRAEDSRWGLNATATGWVPDQVAYHWGSGTSEGSTEAYAVDVIARHCAIPGMHEPPAPAWFDLTANGVRWTLRGFDPSVATSVDAGLPPPVDAGPPPPVDAGMTAPRPSLPDAFSVVRDLANERPDLLRGSCVDMGGNNEFLFEVVRRLRRSDRRWGLNWKRGRVGDLSQDVVDYYFGPGEPTEGSTDVYIVDIIGGHCGPTPAPIWLDVTAATAAGGTIGRWTLAGRSDLGP